MAQQAMLKNTVIFGSIIGAAVAVPFIHQANPDLLRSVLSSEATVQKVSVDTMAGREAPRLSTVTEIPMDARGHFVTDFKFNGRRVESMVDTGATFVAINESTARRVGVRVVRDDFKYKVSTANGQTPAASVLVDEISVGNIKIRNVPALVLKDDALKGTLIGMSFLKELDRFTIEDRTLILRR